MYRSQDKARVLMLDEVVERAKLNELFGRLDHGGELRQRYETLVGKPR